MNIHKPTWLIAASALLCASAAAQITPTGSVSGWLGAVATGTPASYVNSGFSGPIVDDVGPTSGTNGVTYEFIVYGDNGGISSGLMGYRTGGLGEGLKFEQCCDSLQYGITDFGILDYYFPGGNNTEGVDIQLVFVVDTVGGTTELFENGVSFGVVNIAPVLSGMQGIGQILDPGGNFDIMSAGQIHGVAIYEAPLTAAEIQQHRDAYLAVAPGTNYCMAAANSTGSPSSMSAMGSSSAAANNLTLLATGLPRNQFGIFIVSQTQGFVPGVGGTSNGNLCIGGAIGRYSNTGEIVGSGQAGEFAFAIDTTAIRTPNGSVPAMPGETWNFQAWHRDTVGLGSNFTDGLEVLFN